MLFLPLAFLLDDVSVLKTDDSSRILDRFGAGTLSMLRGSALIVVLLSNASEDLRLSWWFLLLSKRSMLFLPLAFLLDDFFVLQLGKESNSAKLIE